GGISGRVVAVVAVVAVPIGA
ncbi:hypothetical protein Tco_0512897, partial [Tanacetum coccineum]